MSPTKKALLATLLCLMLVTLAAFSGAAQTPPVAPHAYFDGPWEAEPHSGHNTSIPYTLRATSLVPRVYMPLVVRDLVPFYEGLWEREPNNTASQANGSLHSGREYYGYANDGQWPFVLVAGGIPHDETAGRDAD